MMNTHKGDIWSGGSMNGALPSPSMASCAMSAAEWNVNDAPRSWYRRMTGPRKTKPCWGG